MRMDHVTVGGTDLERSEAFYRSLGLRVIVKTDHYLRFECPDGDATFSVDLVDEVGEGEQVTVYFEDDDLDHTCERIRRDGIGFEHPPTDMAWLWREARLRDPDGHRLCIFYGGDARRYPPWRVS